MPYSYCFNCRLSACKGVYITSVNKIYVGFRNRARRPGASATAFGPHRFSHPTAERTRHRALDADRARVGTRTTRPRLRAAGGAGTLRLHHHGSLPAAVGVQAFRKGLLEEARSAAREASWGDGRRLSRAPLPGRGRFQAFPQGSLAAEGGEREYPPALGASVSVPLPLRYPATRLSRARIRPDSVTQELGRPPAGTAARRAAGGSLPSAFTGQARGPQRCERFLPLPCTDHAERWDSGREGPNSELGGPPAARLRRAVPAGGRRSNPSPRFLPLENQLLGGGDRSPVLRL